MTDRHELTAANVEELVTEDALGVYMLYEAEDGDPRFVGRTEELRSRLIEHADDGYDWFWADYMPNATRAYEKQVELYHFNGEDELDNDGHPERPHKNVKCKLCD